MGVIEKSIHYVTDAMEGKKRKGNGSPAVFHSLEAASIAASLTSDESVIAAAVLHDVIEDTDKTGEDIKSEFGPLIFELVMSETEDKSKDWKTRKILATELVKNTDDIRIKILYLSDKLSNMRSLYNDIAIKHEKAWNDFNQKDPLEHHWYYRTIADSMPELYDTVAWQEYDRLIKIVFDEDDKAGA